MLPTTCVIQAVPYSCNFGYSDIASGFLCHLHDTSCCMQRMLLLSPQTPLAERVVAVVVGCSMQVRTGQQCVVWDADHTTAVRSNATAAVTGNMVGHITGFLVEV